MTSIGHRIEAKRSELGLTQETLAEKIGVHRTSVYAWEADKAQPRGRNLHNLGKALGVRAEWLKDGQGSPGESIDPLAGAQMENAYIEHLLAKIRKDIEAGSNSEDQLKQLVALENEYKSRKILSDRNLELMQINAAFKLKSDNDLLKKFGLFKDYLNSLISERSIQISEHKQDMILNKILDDFRLTGEPPQKETIEFYLELSAKD